MKVQYDALPSQKLLAFQSRFFQKLDATFSVHIFGGTGYATTDPRNLEAMNNTRFQDFELGLRKAGCFPFLGDGIFTHDGPEWKRDRDALRRQFARVQSQNLDTFQEPVEKLIAQFRESEGIVDLQPAFFYFTLGTTTGLLFGESINSLAKEQQEEFSDAFDHASYITAVRLRLAEFCWLYTPKKYKQSCATVRRYARHFVQKALEFEQQHGHEKAMTKYPFILDLLSELGNADEIPDQLVNVLLAGRDTTACTLGWAFFHLVRHRPVLDKLHDEISNVLGAEQKFTRNDLRRMPYLKAVLDESLRLYPQIPINVRFANKLTLIPKGGGPDGESPIMLPKGMGVGWSPYHMHRRKDLYGEDAEAFRPERWLTGELDGIGGAYIPFHSGARQCLGKDFALTEASYAMVRLIQAYPNIRLPPGVSADPVGQEKQNVTIAVASAEGCKVVLH